MGLLRKLWSSSVYSWQGLYYAYTKDKSFRLEVCASLLFIVFGLLFWPLSTTELLFLVLSYFLILIMELMNTAIEALLARLHPERNELIGSSKDTASAAVFLAVVFAVCVAAVIVYGHMVH